MIKSALDRATQGKMATTKIVRDQKYGKVQTSFQTGLKSLLKVWGAFCDGHRNEFRRYKMVRA